MKFYSVISLTAIAASSLLVGQNPPDPSFVEQYPPEFIRNYSQECVRTSIAEGLEEAEANKLCDCTLDKFQQQYTLEEFKELTIASNTDQVSQDALIETGQVCFEELLYE
ncbi:hypothetical protein [Myxosarcina sp. GI1(2024)]